MAKKTSKSKAAKKYHVLKYVENCSPRLRKFSSIRKMNDFILDFQSQYPNPESGWWVDYAITDISGKVLFLDDTLNNEIIDV